MEPLVVLNQLSPGTRVAFNDGDTWAEGVVEESNCIGAALVRYEQSISSIAFGISLILIAIFEGP